MATKRPIVLYSGSLRELAAADSVPLADAATRATTVQATDSRVLKPSDFSPSAVAGIPWGTRSWFSSKTGMETGTVGTDYGDVLSLSNYTDASGGLVNALFMSKGGAALYHYQGTWNGSTWNAPKQIAYTDSAMSGNTSGNAATATKLATPRAIGITGAVTGTATNFDGSAAINIPVTAVDLTSAAMSGLLGVDHGSTGQTSYTVGDMLYASGAAALSKLAAVAVGNVLRSGGVGTAPAWGKVALSTDVTGTLPIANLPSNIATTDTAQTFTNKTLTSPAINGNTIVTAANFTHTNAGPVKHLVVTGSSGSGNDAVLAVGRTATDHAAFLQWEQAGAVRWQMGLAVGDTSHNLPLYYYDASNVQQLFAYFTRGGTARFYPAIEASGGLQVGSSATASQNFTMRVDGAGGFKISRGNASGPTADPVAISATNVVTLAQPLPVGSGGTGDTGTAWTSVAATFAPVSGAFADASGLVWHKRIGKTVFINASLTITNNNTGGGGVRLTLPWTANNGAVLAGREDAATGNMLQGVCTPGTKNCTIFTYNNNYPGGTGYVLRINGVYETSDA